MKWVVVILKQPGYYLTLGTVRYNRWGQRNRQSIITCNTWTQGFTQALEQGFDHALFVKPGTVFGDWEQWCNLINNYPHQGLVGHIIWHPNGRAYLDDQCWLMELKKFSVADFDAKSIQQPVPVRSKTNLHDNYTPVWIKPTNEIETFESDEFGQGLIARQLNNYHGVVNWNNLARDIKHFEYRPGEARTWLQEYIDLAETQLWIFNNELIPVTPAEHIVTPGSGLRWILHKCHPEVKTIDIVDISRTQLDFCKQLQYNWNGQNYGQFVWDYIQRNNLKHYELDQPNLTQVDRLRFKKQQFFVDYVNKVFYHTLAEAGIEDFKTAWSGSQCQINIVPGNLLNYPIPPSAQVWMSNILDYKYTLVTTDYDTLDKYEKTN
jgi:hypothetical protein